MPTGPIPRLMDRPRWVSWRADRADGGSPQGHLGFRLNRADVRFASESFDWLVVTDQTAFLRGGGTVNGEGAYQFLLAMTDAGVNGRGAADHIRLKIWDGQTGTVVYDSQPGAPEDASPYTPLHGGNIIVHTGGSNLLAMAGTSQGHTVQPLTTEQLTPVVAAALTYWEAAGFQGDQLEALHRVEVRLADFEGARLGLASTSTNIVWIDVDAAGYGWRMPEDTDPTSTVGMDLWRAVTHELGHMLGLEDLDYQTGRDHIMAGAMWVNEPLLHPIASARDAWDSAILGVTADELVDRNRSTTPVRPRHRLSDPYFHSLQPLPIGSEIGPRSWQPRAFDSEGKRRQMASPWNEDWLGPEEPLLDQLAAEQQRLWKRR